MATYALIRNCPGRVIRSKEPRHEASVQPVLPVPDDTLHDGRPCQHPPPPAGNRPTITEIEQAQPISLRAISREAVPSQQYRQAALQHLAMPDGIHTRFIGRMMLDRRDIAASQDLGVGNRAQITIHQDKALIIGGQPVSPGPIEWLAPTRPKTAGHKPAPPQTPTRPDHLDKPRHDPPDRWRCPLE